MNSVTRKLLILFISEVSDRACDCEFKYETADELIDQLMADETIV